ncbi:MAG: hypothetical protein IKG86_09115 [Paludibacteraceae bacterium]|nr:hypothetical protein [Paludibacteraceae bacterium]
MGKVTYSPGIQYVQGAMSKPKKVDGHSHGDYLIGTHRTAPTENPDCTRLYIRKADTYDRKTAPSANELVLRSRFSQAVTATQARMKNLSTLEADRAAFNEQKDLAGGKKTFYAYIFKLEYDKLRG